MSTFATQQVDASVICLLLPGLILFLFALKKYIRWYTNPLWKEPIAGPSRSSTSFLLGQILTIMNGPLTKLHKKLYEEAKESGLSTDYIHFCIAGGGHVISTRDPSIAKQILCNNVKFPKQTKYAVHMFGNSMVTAEVDGEMWKRHRRIIQPSFQKHFLTDSLNSIVPQITQKLISYWKLSEGRDIHVSKHLSLCTLDVIGLAGFAHDFHGMDSIKKWSEDNITGDLDPVTDRLMVAMNDTFAKAPIRLILHIFKLGKLLDWKGYQIKKVMNTAVDSVLAKARSKASNIKAAAKQDYAVSATRSLLEALLEAEDPYQTNRKRLNHQELRDEIKAFLLAGHETTSTWCTWCLFTLCQYPDVQQKIYDDIMKHSPSTDDH